MKRLRNIIQKKIRPNTFLGFFIYNLYYNLFSFYKQIYFFYPKGNFYIGKVFSFFGKSFTFKLKSKSAIVFVYECFILKLYDSHLNIEAGDYVLDCGSNCGIFSIYASNKVGEAGKIYSIEPGQENFKFLLENITLNKVNNVVAINNALYNSITKLNFFISREDFNSSLIFNDKQNHYTSEIVNAVTLDSILFDYDIKRVDFIKIDVEGAELECLEGAKKSLSLSSKIIVADLKSSDKNFKRILSILDEHGYLINTSLLPEIHGVKDGS